jgi:hypothetical protein
MNAMNVVTVSTLFDVDITAGFVVKSSAVGAAIRKFLEALWVTQVIF